MDKEKLMEKLEDIQETFKYELKFNGVPKRMQLDIMESLNDLETKVYAALGYQIIHPKQ